MAQDRRQLTPIDYANFSGQDLCLKYLNDVIGRWGRQACFISQMVAKLLKHLTMDQESRVQIPPVAFQVKCLLCISVLAPTLRTIILFILVLQ